LHHIFLSIEVLQSLDTQSVQNLFIGRRRKTSKEQAMTLIRVLTALAALAASGAALADIHCADPIADWKPRELLRQQAALRGWTVQRIKVDDGCYEIRGIDRRGNKVKARYGPATLRIRSLEVDFGPDGDASDYLRPVGPKGERRGPPAHSSKGNNT
jgi:hypothetical protein